MKTSNEFIEKLISYLEENLIHRGNNFKKVGPRSFIYIDDADSIFVYVGDSNLLICNDGENVSDGVAYNRIFPGHLDGTESDKLVFDYYLQLILSYF